MLVFLDANVVVSDRLFRRSRWQDLDAAVGDGRVDVAIPQIAVLEATEILRATQRDTARSIRAGARKASSAVRAFAEQAAVQAEREGDEYRDVLAALLEEHAVEIVPTPDVSHEELAGRAIRRVRPFDDSGSGYRDSLHWFILLDRAVGEEEVVFVSADRRAFYADASSAVPHPHLLQDLAARGLTCALTLARSITDVTVPGVLRAENLNPEDLRFDLEAALLEELNATISTALDLRPDDVGLSDVDAVVPLRFNNLRLRSHLIREYYVDSRTEIQAEARADLSLRTSTLVERDELVEDTRSVKVDIALETSTSSATLGPVTVTGLSPALTPTPATLDAAAQMLSTFARAQQCAAVSPNALKGIQTFLESFARYSYLASHSDKSAEETRGSD